MDLAAQFYAETLWSGGRGGAAVPAGRGIDPEVAKGFGPRYAARRLGDPLGFMKTQQITERPGHAGLAVSARESRGAYDRFRGADLPIRDLQGRVVAFGGRGVRRRAAEILETLPRRAVHEG